MSWTEWEVVNDGGVPVLDTNYTSREAAVKDARMMARSLPNNIYSVVKKDCEIVFKTIHSEESS